MNYSGHKSVHVVNRNVDVLIGFIAASCTTMVYMFDGHYGKFCTSARTVIDDLHGTARHGTARHGTACTRTPYYVS